jgi:hypothetical protein
MRRPLPQQTMLTLLTVIGTGVSGKNTGIVEGYRDFFQKARSGRLVLYSLSVPVETKGFIKARDRDRLNSFCCLKIRKYMFRSRCDYNIFFVIPVSHCSTTVKMMKVYYTATTMRSSYKAYCYREHKIQ